MFPLTVYKASAGSGKTFTLATEYICLLLKNPLDYKKILAVTFTNKATTEMKDRIVSQLYGIAHGLKGSQAYMDKICGRLQISAPQASDRARLALGFILHDYSHFRVDTIDSFFQAVLRNLARELDLSANLRVELEEKDVIDEAVNQTVDSLNADGLKWVVSWVNAQMDDDKAWNVIPDIKKLSHELTTDFYNQKSQELYQKVKADPHFFQHYKQMLRKMKEEARQEMQKVGDEFAAQLEANGLTPDDFSGKKGGFINIISKCQAGVFPKGDKDLITKTMVNMVDHPEKWYAKTHKRGAYIEECVRNGLNELLRRAIAVINEQTPRYKTAEAIGKKLHELALLHLVDATLRRMNGDARRIFLSDTQHLLSTMMGTGDAPFVFEKTGGRLEHIMIDEFQDTSTTQWSNFRKLINEVMNSQGGSNLIVGDVKQSIYRFRGGDSSMLMHIDRQFPHPEEQLKIESLATNYRSSHGVVTFNNAFFQLAAQAEGVEGYDDVAQQLPPGRKEEGQVRVTLLPKEDYEDATLRLLLDQINEALAAGAKMEQMAILVRKNDRLKLFAQYVAREQPSLRLISDETYQLDASPAISTLIAALRALTVTDEINRAYLLKMCGQESYDALMADKPRLIRMPLFDLLEELSRRLRLETMSGQAPYLCTFYDLVASYLADHTPDLDAFLGYWDNYLYRRTIQTPQQNGIRMLTIHKAKGLEFSHVFCPFYDWQMEKNDTIWVEPKEAPFNQVPIAPVNFNKDLQKTIFANDYDSTHTLNVADNLNLLYVAFTRASCNLSVIGKRGAGAGQRSLLIEQLMQPMAERVPGAVLTGQDDPQEPLQLCMGQWMQPSAKAAQTEPNVFLQTEKELPVELHFYDNKVEYRQGIDQLLSAPDDEEEALRRSYIQKGRVLHRVLQSIVTPDDIDRVLIDMEADGELDNINMNRHAVAELLRKRMSGDRVKEWFSPRWTLYNECAILSTDPVTHKTLRRRPDRVMTDGERWIVVDFKFGNPRRQYYDQVKEYMNLIRQMGATQVEGWLWMVYSGETISI